MILDMYLTMSSVILGGILNMLFVKTSFYKKHNTPIDGNKNFLDGKRILGENKTWIGFFSMIFFCVFSQLLTGFMCSIFNITKHNQIYDYYDNTILYNICTGFLFGLFYMLFELPNSFVKRRLNIGCGKTNKDFIGKIFFVIDQVDSLFGVMLILMIFSKISWVQYFEYILLGGLTHILVNFSLYKLRVRKNI